MSNLESWHHLNPPSAAVVPESGPAATLPPLEVELARLVGGTRRLKPLLAGVLQLAVERTAATFAGLYVDDASGHLAPLASFGRLEPDGAAEVVTQCRSAIQAGRTICRRPGGETGPAVVTAPILPPGQPPAVLTALIPSSGPEVRLRAEVIDHLAAAVFHWRMMETLRRLEWEAHTSSAVLELVTAIAATRSMAKACLLAVNELKRLMKCDQVAISLARHATPPTQLRAISGLAEFDASSETVRLLSAALDEAVIRDRLTSWPPLQSNDRHALLAHRRLAEASRDEAYLTAPLKTEDGRLVGAILLNGRRELVHDEAAIHAVQALGPHLAEAIDQRVRSEPGWLGRGLQLVRQSTRLNRAIGLAAAVILTVIPFIPCRHTVRTTCLVEPVTRRFLTAPYEGLLKHCLVRPGDVVHQGQVLARMDDRELRWELSSLVAERGRAAKKRDVAMAAHDTSEAQMAELEMQRMDLKIKLIQNRQANLDILSPLSGVVLKGDLQDAEGAPVKAGQGLFEIAPLDQVQIELAVLEDDLPYVTVSLPVEAHLDGEGRRAVRGRIETIRPRAEIRNDQNVFVAEVIVDNPATLLRPGMNGDARIRAGLRPLAWIWLHKLYHRLLVLLGR